MGVSMIGESAEGELGGKQNSHQVRRYSNTKHRVRETGENGRQSSHKEVREFRDKGLKYRTISVKEVGPGVEFQKKKPESCFRVPDTIWNLRRGTTTCLVLGIGTGHSVERNLLNQNLCNRKGGLEDIHLKRAHCKRTI